MRLLRGPIGRMVIVAYTSISLLAILTVSVAVFNAQQNLSLAADVHQRSDLALLSARIRSECLTLTDMVEAYVYQTPGQSVSREEIAAQTQKLDDLINQAIDTIDPYDVDESLELGNIRQGLISFRTQAQRVLDAFDEGQEFGPLTSRELAFLTENYQTPLLESLQRFEEFETGLVADSLEKMNQSARRISNIMIGAAILAVVTAFIVSRETTLRFAIPLSRLRESVERMRIGLLNTRIDIDTRDEMGDLARALNQMSAELQESHARLEEYANTLEEQVKARTVDLRKLTIAVDQSPSSVVITDTQGRIEYANPRFTELTGYTIEESLGKNPNILQSGLTSRDVYKDLWTTITSGHIWKGEFINRKKNGDIYWEEAIISPVRNEDGKTTHYIAIKEDISHRKETEKELRRLATIDPLTEAYNRRQFFLLAEFAVAEAERYHTSLSAIMMDVDHFKSVNDNYGHQAGDAVLRGLVYLVREQIRDVDVFGRYGGEEFALVLPHTLPEQAVLLAERIRDNVQAQTFDYKNQKFSVTISLGVAAWDAEQNDLISQLMEKADTALYRAKQTGRNRVVVYQPDMTSPKEQQRAE